MSNAEYLHTRSHTSRVSCNVKQLSRPSCFIPDPRRSFRMAMLEHLARLLFIACGAYLVYLTFLVIYRLCFHPLAQFPGPRYAAISRWHEFYYEVVLKGQFTFKVQELHKQYGSSTASQA